MVFEERDAQFILVECGEFSIFPVICPFNYFSGTCCTGEHRAHMRLWQRAGLSVINLCLPHPVKQLITWCSANQKKKRPPWSLIGLFRCIQKMTKCPVSNIMMIYHLQSQGHLHSFIAQSKTVYFCLVSITCNK